MVNAGNASVPLATNFDTAYKSVNGTIMVSTETGDWTRRITDVGQTNENVNGFNYRNNATAIVPMPASIPASAMAANGSSFSWDVPAFSITVLQFDL